jgi:uncharacterized membrane protein YfcA
MVDSSRVVTYLSGGLRLEPQFLWGLLVFVPVPLLGVAIGRRMVDRIPQDKFRKVISAFPLLAGLKLALFP